MSLNINTDDNALDFELAKSVGEYFRLSEKEMDVILHEVLSAVKEWKTIASLIEIPKKEQELMEKAFKY